MGSTLVPLAEIPRDPRRRAEVGGKALYLARLVDAGLPVPDGFVVPAGALGDPASRPALEAAIRGAAARLGARVVVRSSAVVEDRAEGAAAGLFLSQPDIRPEDVPAAAAQVIASAARPAVIAYLERRGMPAVAPAIAVVVQRQVGASAGSAHGVLYTRPPGRPQATDVRLEAAGAGRRQPSSATARREDGALVRADGDFPLDAPQVAALVALALAAEHAIEATRGADIEWVLEGGVLWLVQARPLLHPPRAQVDPVLAAEMAFSRVRSSRVWRWDAAHNPDPLSPAQAGLVELVGDLSSDEMRVVAGHLYTAPREQTAAASTPAPDATAVVALYRDEVLPAASRALEPVEGEGAPALEDALAAYRAVYRTYAVLAPALASARRSLPPVLASSAVARALAEDDGALAALSPAWDVAAPTFAESRDLLEHARTAWSRRSPASAQADAQDPDDPSVSLARRLAEIAEADDLLFFRAQRAVRRALLALASSWRLDPPDDVFFVPLDRVRAAAAAGTPLDRDDAHATAAATRGERAAHHARAMPLAFRDGQAITPPATLAGPRGGAAWRGVPAAPGTARGTALRTDDLGALGGDLAGRVVVALSITPAALVQIIGAAALVCEHGGALDHAAALARELGLPCVVGCLGSARAISDGDELLVDGDAGVVVRLRRAGRLTDGRGEA